MLIKFVNNLLSIGLLLMLYHLMVRAAVIQQLNNTILSQQKVAVPHSAANYRDEVIIPILSSSPADNPDVPYFKGFRNYPHVQLDRFNDDPEPVQDPSPVEHSPQSRKVDEFEGDMRLPNEEPYYQSYNRPHSSPHRSHNRRTTTEKPKKKLYKAIERVYYYPQDDSEHEPTKSKDAINAMKEFMPDTYETDYNEEDPNDQPEPQDFEPRKDLLQMQQNPPRQDRPPPPPPDEQQEDDQGEGDVQESDGTQASIANDVKEFGKEAVDEANKFDSFLDNLRNFAVNSEKEYNSPNEGDEHIQDSPETQDSDDGIEERRPNPTYRDSLAAQAADDRTRDYEKVANYGNPDGYEPEKKSYQNQKDRMDRSGHRFHKDRRRPRPKKQDEAAFEQRNHEVSGLIDSEPDEGDYLSNYDVVKQLKNSEQKYNTGIDPVYSSQKDFDEVKRLEKMIENVALLNKEKEKMASANHDSKDNSEANSDGTNEGSETKTKITKVKTKDVDKNDKKESKN